MYDDENSVISAIRSFARAFVLKRAFSSELLGALHMLARDGSYLSSQVTDRLLTHIQRGHLRTHERTARSKRFCRASSRSCGWLPEARSELRSCSISACKPCAAIGRP